MSKSGFVSPLRLADEKAESFGAGFSTGWHHGRGFEQLEREREALLRQPIPRDLNPPELTKLVGCRVLRPFFVGGVARQAGETVELQRHDALSMEAIGKLEILK
jgi:hypothetical protein